MYKPYLILISVLTLTCFTMPLAFSKLFPTEASAIPAVVLPVLDPEQFIKAVNENDAQTQSGLSAKLAKLLGAPPPTNFAPVMTPSLPVNTPTATPKASPATEETPENNSLASPSAPAAPGLNPYIN